MAFWRGKHRDVTPGLVEQAKTAGERAPSRQTLQPAVERDVSRGDRADLRGVGLRGVPAACSCKRRTRRRPIAASPLGPSRLLP